MARWIPPMDPDDVHVDGDLLGVQPELGGLVALWPGLPALAIYTKVAESSTLPAVFEPVYGTVPGAFAPLTPWVAADWGPLPDEGTPGGRAFLPPIQALSPTLRFETGTLGHF